MACASHAYSNDTHKGQLLSLTIVDRKITIQKITNALINSGRSARESLELSIASMASRIFFLSREE